MLLLTPEAFLPLRAVGAQFHASMEGAAAAGRAFEILDTPVPARPVQPDQPLPCPKTADLRTAEIKLDGITVAYPARPRAALDGVSLTVAPGERIVLTGPSGAGKSTLLALLLRFLAPAAWTIEADGGGYSRDGPAAVATADRMGAAAALPVLRKRSRQHRARPAGREP